MNPGLPLLGLALTSHSPGVELSEDYNEMCVSLVIARAPCASAEARCVILELRCTGYHPNLARNSPHNNIVEGCEIIRECYCTMPRAHLMTHCQLLNGGTLLIPSEARFLLGVRSNAYGFA